jgi:hypothetical protein
MVFLLLASCTASPSPSSQIKAEPPAKPPIEATTGPSSNITDDNATIAVTPTPTPTVEKPLSFEDEHYTNATYGFSIQYPKYMTVKKVTAPAVFAAADPNRIPYVSAYVFNIATADEETNNSITGFGATDIKNNWSQDATLSDGKTKGKLTSRSFVFFGLPLTSLALEVDQGDKCIAIAYMAKSPIDETKAKEVIFTLTFNKSDK